MSRLRLGTAAAASLLLPALLSAAAPPVKPASSSAGAPLLLRDPSLSRTQIAFAFGGSIWVVPRTGGTAMRVTAGPGVQSHPIFSPDGTRIAFTGEYDGNTDVYVVPAAGGDPVRLTYHPAADRAVGWSPDGTRVLFLSNRNSYSRFDRLFSVAVSGGGLPAQLPLPMAEQGAYSPDGTRVAYDPVDEWVTTSASWKRYRGGLNGRVWLANLADSSVVKLPNAGSNDVNPLWVGNAIYFLSDRGTGPDGTGAAQPLALYRYDIASQALRKVADAGTMDIKSAQAGPEGKTIVYETMGAIHLLDLKSGKSTVVPIEVHGDFPASRPHWERVGGQIQNFDISPTGERAVFEAHGDILTVPAKHGDVRDITATPGVEERYPAWSPDGQKIAFFSDASGEYDLRIVAQDGMGKDGHGDERVIRLGTPPSFFYTPVWSPDGKKIAYTDKRLNLWYVDLTQATPAPVKVATQYYDLSPQFTPAWSPDSRWLAFSLLRKNRLYAVEVYSLADGATHQLTDGLSDARMPVFDGSGKYLYFAASTDLGQSRKGIDMTGIDHPVTSSIYCLVLRRDLPSPLEPRSDEEPAAGKKPLDKGAGRGEAMAPPEVRIDFDQVSQRILALPVPAAAYTQLAAGKAGTLFFSERAPVAAVAGEVHPAVWRWDMAKREREKVLDNATAWTLSANGEKLLYRAGGGRGGAGARWFIVPATGPTPVRPGEGALATADLQVYVDPPAEWRQMYRETWRIERDFLYDPGAHGLDIPAAEQYYAQYLPGLVSRDDLNYLFNEMLGQITIGHMFVRGGALPEAPRVPGGLLGADYRVANGRYQFAKIYQGENWNPGLSAPLTQPGVNVAEGEYLLAVNGREVRATDNLYRFFEQTAGKQTVLRVGPNADGTGARNVTVEPLASETALRNRDWMRTNMALVDRLSRGKLAYVYLPDTANGGYTNFNRYYYAQLDKQGAVLDERFNSGGDIADYIIDNLHRPQFASFLTRQGAPWAEPAGSIFGPKVMVTNFYAGSGGDAMPWMFRNAKIGPLVGTRTWGGLVGIGGYPVLMDGGTVTAPREAFYNMQDAWDVENHGVAPDYEVMLDPQAWRAGRDPQLEKAVEVCLELLAKHPPVVAKVPAYPNYHQPFPAATPATAVGSAAAAGGGGRH